VLFSYRVSLPAAALSTAHGAVQALWNYFECRKKANPFLSRKRKDASLVRPRSLRNRKASCQTGIKGLLHLLCVRATAQWRLK
jgi:hypothetical protein